MTLDGQALRQAQESIQAAWSGQDWEIWEASCAAAYTFRPLAGLALDRAQTLAWSKGWFTAFPDYTELVTGVHVAAESVVYEVTGRGASAAEFVLNDVVLIPNTGRRFEIVYAKILTFDDAMKVVTDHQYSDQAALRQQLGL